MGPDQGCKRCCTCGSYLRWRRDSCSICHAQCCTPECANEHRAEAHPNKHNEEGK